MLFEFVVNTLMCREGSKIRGKKKTALRRFVNPLGLEPRTPTLKVLCSAN